VTEFLVSDQKKIEILEALADRKSHTYYNLAKHIKTNYETVKKNCKFLERLDLVEIKGVSKEESASNRPYYGIKITDKGMEFIRGYKEND